MSSKIDIRLPDELLSQVLSNATKGPKNHLICTCPLCGKDRHFYFNTETQKWDCKKCGKGGDIVRLLTALNKLTLIRRFVDITKPLQSRISRLYDEEPGLLDDLKESTTPVSLPVGFKFVKHHDYLASRGFAEDDYRRYPVGITNLSFKREDYVIFLVYEDKVVRGYVGRKTWSKQRLREYETKTGKVMPRYSNSENNFSLLLYGIDEIMFYVDTVILVEGVFTKIAVDRRLGIQVEDNFRCLATFGKKISPLQIMKLLLRGIKNVILIFDEDAVEESYKYARLLQKWFKVQVGFVAGGDLDECSDEAFVNCFNNLRSPVAFRYGVIPQRKLIK